MSEPHINSSLRAKRAEISGIIRDLERQLKAYRANLANLDGVIRMFAPSADPESIKPIRPYRRSLYFKSGELARRTSELLREASGPITLAEMATVILQAKGMNADDPILSQMVANRVQDKLRAMLKRGTIQKAGEGRAAKWGLVG